MADTSDTADEVNPPEPASTSKALLPGKVLLVLASACMLGLFVYVASRRFAYPFEVEWLENESLELIRRLTDGQPIYTPPSAELVQVPYAPLSFYVAAAVGSLFGVDYSLARGLSIAATVVTVALLYKLVVRETASRVAGIVAAGLYVASFRVTGAFLDVGKSDSLFMAFTIAAIFAVRSSDRRRNAVVGGALMALAILTKQTALFFAVPIAFYLLATKRRCGALFTGTTAALVLVPSIAMHWASDGWYTFFVWELLFEHDVLPGSKFAVLAKDLSSFWPAIVLMVASVFVWAKREHWWTSGFYIAVIGGLIAGAWTGRLHTGGYENVLLPAALAVSIGAGIALGRVLSAGVRLPVAYGAMALCLMQLIFLRYDAGAQIPTPADERAGNALVEQMRAVPGDIFIPRHNTYAVLAGKRAYAGEGGIEDIVRGSDFQAQELLRESLERHIHQKRFAAIILDGSDDARGFPADWQDYYTRLDTPLPADTGALRPVTNRTGSPAQWWVPRP